MTMRRVFATPRQALARLRQSYSKYGQRRHGAIISIHDPNCDTKWAGECNCTPRQQIVRAR